MTRCLRRCLHEDGGFKAFIADATELGRNAFEDLQPSPVALQLITQAMTGALLLSANLKEGVINLKLTGDGPLGHLTAEANTLGEARATAGDLHLQLPRAPDQSLLGQALGQGQLTVRRKSRQAPSGFSSVVDLVPGGFSLNLANYLDLSEQTPSAIRIDAQLDPDRGVAGAGGILIQALPGADLDILAELESRLAQMTAIGPYFSEPEGFRQIFDILFHGMSVKQLGATPLSRKINDDPAALRQVLAGLPLNELTALEKEGRPVTLRNAFGGKPRVFGLEELADIIREKRAQSE